MHITEKKIVFLNVSFIFFLFLLISNLFGTLEEISICESLLDCRSQTSPYECAFFSAHVYNDLEAGNIPPITVPGWTVHKVYSYESGGYYGAIYINHRKKQIVLAHRGTYSLQALWTDLESVVCNRYGKQQKFLQNVMEDVEAVMKLQKEIKGEEYALTITGHSLGGWLAQISFLIAKLLDLDAYRISAITFDSPGGYPMLKKMTENSNLCMQFDITLYFSSPNIVNTCNLHTNEGPDAQGNHYIVGSRYRIFPKPNKKEQSTLYCLWDTFFDFAKIKSIDPLYVIKSHDLGNFLEVFDPVTGREKEGQCLPVVSWPFIKPSEASRQLIQEASLKGLNSLESFLDLADKSNFYCPKDLKGEDSFKLAFEAHYCLKEKENRAHIRHLPYGVKHFLKNRNKLSNTSWQEQIAFDEKDTFLVTHTEEDIRIFVDKLHILYKEKKELFREYSQEKAVTFLGKPFHQGPLFVHRQEDESLLIETLLNQGKDERTIAAPIVGWGGIGKSCLAFQVAEQCKKKCKYDHIVWISCGFNEEKTPNALSIDQAYAEIYDQLQLPYAEEQKEKVMIVKKYLDEKFCLYIFDDASGLDQIKPYLPAKGHVLITSRNSNPGEWGGYSPYTPSPFTDEEMISFLSKFSIFQNKPSFLERIITYLPRYPLPLNQVVSVLNNNGLSSIEECMAFLEDEESLLEALSTALSSEGYDKALSKVIENNMMGLQKEENGQAALLLLTKLAFFDPNNIPLDWILEMDEKARKLLLVLEKRSLIKWDRSTRMIHVHQTIQFCVRKIQFGENPVTVVESPLLTLIDQWIKKICKGTISEKRAQAQFLLHHGRAFFSHIEKASLEGTAILAHWLGYACNNAFYFEESLIWANKELDAKKILYEDTDHPSIAITLKKIAYALSRLGNFENALEYYEKALEIRQMHDDDFYIAISLNDVGCALARLTRFEEALKFCKKALEIGQRIYKGDNRDVATFLNDVGYVLSYLKHFEDGVKYYKEALEMRRRIYNCEDHASIAKSLNNVGCGLCNLEFFKSALEYFQQAYEMQQRIYQGKVHPSLATCINNIGYALINMKEYRSALEYFEEALKMRKAIYGNKDCFDVLQSLINLGHVLAINSPVRNVVKSHKYLAQARSMKKRLSEKNVYISTDNVGIIWHTIWSSPRGRGYGNCYSVGDEAIEENIPNYEWDEWDEWW